MRLERKENSVVLVEKGMQIKRIGKARNDRLEMVQHGSSRKLDLVLEHR